MAFGIKILSQSGDERLVGYEPKNILTIKVISPWIETTGSFTVDKEFSGTLSWEAVGAKLLYNQTGGTSDNCVEITIDGNTISWEKMKTNSTAGKYVYHSQIALVAMVERS